MAKTKVPEWYNPNQASKLIGKSVTTVWRWCESDPPMISRAVLPSGQYQIHRDEINRILRESGKCISPCGWKVTDLGKVVT